ncbi:isoprenylcysteine carboxylmethyltransferase family protein [Vibrio sp. ZSDZ34]|jgi:protein-S-isoprenylcysteine O-methyltransferase Ste14|uniref:Isoprenylcysteine carboxylmethyltransferase family protein n=1 Tax=Vibrio gelatinilyticus TaxID=2893468 RepID=A0A9X2AWI7_9VIBR|nr:isoprenylcysteine carboxylmethyltransferase family protein [Vibrio gelatinilyticus]MCJ2377410.1 isoprenylcysteine carboxylmethyltransferase family protein [Vibrio gelatinilyticus]
MKALELKIPPVAVFLLFAIIMYAMGRIQLGIYTNIPGKLLWVSAFVIISVVVGFSGVREFHKATTTVNPTTPDKASTIVDTGIFRQTRNPMYVSLLLLLFAWGVWLEDIVALIFSWLFVAYMNQFQIKPEERALERLFGEDYLDYKSKVRRWI